MPDSRPLPSLPGLCELWAYAQLEFPSMKALPALTALTTLDWKATLNVDATSNKAASDALPAAAAATGSQAPTPAATTRKTKRLGRWKTLDLQCVRQVFGRPWSDLLPMTQITRLELPQAMRPPPATVRLPGLQVLNWKGPAVMGVLGAAPCLTALTAGELRCHSSPPAAALPALNSLQVVEVRNLSYELLPHLSSCTHIAADSLVLGTGPTTLGLFSSSSAPQQVVPQASLLPGSVPHLHTLQLWTFPLPWNIMAGLLEQTPVTLIAAKTLVAPITQPAAGSTSTAGISTVSVQCAPPRLGQLKLELTTLAGSTLLQLPCLSKVCIFVCMLSALFVLHAAVGHGKTRCQVCAVEHNFTECLHHCFGCLIHG